MVKNEYQQLARLSNQDQQDLLTNILSLAKDLGLSVIAEGVETREQLTILEKQNCRYCQGFLFSPGLTRER